MTCPRCGNEWDVSKSPCSRCGLLVNLPGRLRTTRSAASATQQQTAKTPPPTPSASSGAQQPGGALSFPSPNMPTPFPMPPGRDGAGSAGSSYTPQSDATQTRSNMGTSSMPQTPYTDRTYKGIEAGAGTGNAAMPRPSQTDILGGGINQSIPKSVPPRSRSTSEPLIDSPRVQPSLRPRRLVNERSSFPDISPLAPSTLSDNSAASFDLSLSGTVSQNLIGESSASVDIRPLAPGTLLRNGRYRLQAQQERQEWSGGAFEMWWSAQDAQRSAQAVAICEVFVPDNQSMLAQSALRTATMVLTSVGRHPAIPTLWDVFSEHGRNFFVFEVIDGESLLARMRRTGRALPEADVRECCLQMTELLDLLSQQSPPLVHGLIRPEHIMIARFGGRYVLTHFSILLAGGSTQFITGVERAHLSPYTAPEFTRGIADVRSDLYSLLATAYHAVTGSIPSAVGGMLPAAQQMNPTVSAQFDAILAKGLRANVAQRYQRPSELRQELLAMNAVNGSIAPTAATPYKMQSAEAQRMLSAQPEASKVDALLPNMMASIADDFEELDRRLPLPRPEELPPMVERNDLQMAVIWMVGILLVLIVLVVVSRGIA